MELFKEMKIAYSGAMISYIIESGADVDIGVGKVELEMDRWTARMNRLVYGKDKD
ncbi:hypothetical protein [Paenibacillus shenyangensis]|uniref:hypothetical protein n=1 Tax=Paenibacillus sp. A9 TaxID=1284352 RepID=UPI000ABBFBFA|nr:hypothetical protein [Paenibacillus sp. A9]